MGFNLEKKKTKWEIRVKFGNLLTFFYLFFNHFKTISINIIYVYKSNQLFVINIGHMTMPRNTKDQN